ncbi:PAS domain-containing protein [Pseudomonas sp. S75]|uniref:sensor histidine kinase n=1 Tax=unclassified Pseudomonas TaxID=196821 RepID=UPI001906AAB5|nr:MULTISPECIES: PAS domain-containing protein [unclassified Pseudomonas]MBJ9975234.1 PAS domain-containing protein [Pseudomonas sp. S30]MBK0152792.1 PAS domain-containing protein [Pseudomonas sp. S75]
MPHLSPDEIVRAALQISHTRLRRQHELVVGFAVDSLGFTHLDELLTQACAIAAAGMHTPYAKILQPSDDPAVLRLTHGVGWAPADIGSATVGGDEASPAGYAFTTSRPVISNHLGQELRFRTPALLHQYGIERAVNVPIRGTAGTFGVLEADSRDGDDFIESDVVFLEGLANIISLTVERLAAKEEADTPHTYSESVLNASPDCVKILSRSGEVEFFNEAGLCRMQIPSLTDIAGKHWVELWPESSKPVIEDALVRVNRGESVRFESFCPTAQNEPRWWDVTAAPVLDRQGEIDKIIAVSRDITDRHEQEVRFAELIETQNTKLTESGLHVAETHHRVKNSLHLVNSLLLLQANLAVEEAVQTQLQIAANRVMTIANVHEHLYQDAHCEAMSAPDYLRSLLSDIRKAFGEPDIEWLVDPFVLPPERMAPLGLVVSELVTNALKYGRGKITVRIERDGADARVTVTDEGTGFPESYPKPSGTGLGMRLVKSYSGYGDQAITLDRSRGLSSIQVRFRL